MGNLYGTDYKITCEQDIRWSNEPANVLGVIVAEDCDERINRNFQPLYEKVENTLKVWRSRNLTLTGKVLIVNTLVESLFVYRMSCIELMSDSMYEDFHHIIKNFLWPNKVRMRYDILQCPKYHGGLRLVNLKFKHIALLCNWIIKIQHSPFFAKCMYDCLPMGDVIWYCNISTNDAKSIIDERTFWSDVLVAWTYYNFNVPTTLAAILEQFLWYNSHIKVNGELCWNRLAHDKGMRQVKDVFREGAFLTYAEIKSIFGTECISWLEYFSIVNAIPLDWKTTLKRNPNVKDYEFKHNIDICTDKKKVSRYIYYKLCENNTNLSEKLDKWNRQMGSSYTMEEYHKSITNVNLCTITTKLRDFHYRVLTKLLVFNRQLYNWGKN